MHTPEGSPFRGDVETPPNVIGEILVSSRSFAEYCSMFDLTVDDLQRSILDCPGGAASFTAEARTMGADVTACDPVYGQYTTDELAALTSNETQRGNQYCRSHREEYVWTFFAGPHEHAAVRMAAGRQFVSDYRSHPERYVPGVLPHLPFPDRAFELVLSSHLLFSYADRLDLEFHRETVRELTRVGKEVRIFPLVAMGSIDYQHLEALLRLLKSDGIAVQVRRVDYEFQRGGNRMLVCRST